jgi:sporulation protein YlmC with PRC-barrel domain
MMRQITAALLGVLFSLSPTNAGFAKSTHDQSNQSTTVPEAGIARTQDGKALGSVEDFVVNPTTGQIAYAVIATKTRARATNPLLVLPWALAQVSPDRTIFRFMIDNRTLRSAPRISLQTWEQEPVPQWVTAIDTYWAAKVKHDTVFLSPTGVALCKATTLIGVNVQGDNNEHIGTIEELILDSHAGAIAYVVLSRQDVPGNVVFFSLPWNTFYVESRNQKVIALVGTRIPT